MKKLIILSLFAITYKTSAIEIDSLKKVGWNVLNSKTFELRKEYNTILKQEVFKILSEENNDNTFILDSIKNISVIRSKNNDVLVVTWAMPIKTKKNYKYYGYIKKYNNKIFELKDYSTNIADVEKRKLTNNFWFGGLYYKMIPLNKNNTEMILLGWNSSFDNYNIKTIEVLDISKELPVFGKRVFSDKRDLLRKVFKYSKYHSMFLNYNKKMKAIVFDHLSPSDGVWDNDFKKYGPDFTQDMYTIEKQKLILKENILLNNKKIK